MRPPEDIAHDQAAIQDHLAKRFPEMEIPVDPRRVKVSAQAQAFLNSPHYTDLVRFLRDITKPSMTPYIDLGAFNGTASEYAVFRMGVGAVMDMIDNLAKESTTDDLVQ